VRGPRLPGPGLELPLIIKFARWQHPAVRNRARFAVLVTNYFLFKKNIKKFIIVSFCFIGVFSVLTTNYTCFSRVFEKRKTFDYLREAFLRVKCYF